MFLLEINVRGVVGSFYQVPPIIPILVVSVGPVTLTMLYCQNQEQNYYIVSFKQDNKVPKKNLNFAIWVYIY